jgi:transcriptional regulator with XRE-family HTH domain
LTTQHDRHIVAFVTGIQDTLNATPPSQRLRIAITLDRRKQWQIARAANLNPTLLSHYVRGGRTPTPAHQRVIARVLGVPVDVLFTEAA